MKLYTDSSMPAVISTRVCNPFFNLLTVKADDVQAVTESEGGIVIPDVAQVIVIKRTGTVVSVGELVTRVVPGDRVMFAAYAGTTIEIDGEELEIMPDNALMAGID